MKIILRKILIGFFLLLPFYSFLNAQEQDNRVRSVLAIETKVHYGFIARHHPEMNVLTDSHFPVFELTLSKQTFGDKIWEQIYNYPEIGISYWQSSFASSKIMGSAYALYPFIRFPLLRTNRFSLNLRFGVGLGYFSNKFDRFENYKNLAIGSHFNAIINFMFEASYELSKRLLISSGVSLTHFSTGAITVPNYGINIPAVNLGLSYNLSRNKNSNIKRDLPEADRSWEYLIITSFGIKQIDAIEKKKYLVYNVSGDILKPLSIRCKLGGGLDLFYDNSKVDALEEQDISDDKFRSNFGSGAHLTYEQTISRLSILIELGTYIYSRHNIDGNIYEKLLINYLLTSRLLASVSLKAHFGKADYITWGVGYKL